MATPLQLRNAVERLTSEARRDLAALWRQVDTAARAGEALNDILPALIDQYGNASAALASAWYDDLRAKAGAPGRFTAIPAEFADTGTPALVGWALSEATDYTTFQSLIEGGMQRRIANFSRGTVMRSAVADRASAGWKRIGGGACDFCQMLIERDQTYSEATADFASHDHCNCQAYPLIKGAEPIDVKDYVQASRSAQNPGESDAAYEKRRATDRARVREYIATH